MPGIPPAPTQTQFEQIAKAIDPNASVISTRKPGGGISCRMDVLEFSIDGEKTEQAVVRQYYENEKPQEDRPSRRESIALRALDEQGVSAPKLIFGEETEVLLDRPSIVTSYLDGVPNPAPADATDWARQLARAIARVHMIDIAGDLESFPGSMTASVGRWMDADNPPERFAKNELGPAVWKAMRQMWPTVDVSSKQLIHTDLWPGNTVWKDEPLLAIVDWEWPDIGEPSSDIAYFLSDAAYVGLDIEKTFLNAYEAASGKQVKDLLFWKMAAAARAMPDPGPWAQGYSELGIRKMDADKIRRAHSRFVEGVLEEFHTIA